MDKRTGAPLAGASLETPTGLRFPSIEASRPTAAPVLEEYYGFMYIGEMLKEWRTTNTHATLEQLLTEASSEHILWEAERANKELVTFINQNGIVDKILQYAFGINSAARSPAKSRTSPPDVDREEVKSFCQELLSLEVKQGGVFDDSGQTRIIHHLFSYFFTLENEDGKPQFRDPPPEAGTLLQVLAYRPQSREKVLSYLVDTPAEMFVQFFLLHLDNVIVSDLLTTLVSLISEAPPSAWLPTGGPRVLQVSLNEFDVSLRAVLAFNEWLIAGGLVDRIITTIESVDESERDERQRIEIIEKAYALLNQIVMIARTHLLNGILPPPLYYSFMKEARIKPFLSAILQHTNDRVIHEGLGLLASLLICDRMREGEKRKRADPHEDQPQSPVDNSKLSTEKEAELMTISAKRHALKGPEASPEVNRHRKESQEEILEDSSELLESHFNKTLIDILTQHLPYLLRRLSRNQDIRKAHTVAKSDMEREIEAKEAESDAMIRLKQLEKQHNDGGNVRSNGGSSRRPLFGIMRLKIVEFMRALVLHFSVPSAQQEVTEAFFSLLDQAGFAAQAMDLLIENPRMDILHTVIIQTLKPIIMKEKTRFFLHKIVRDGVFIEKVFQILSLCGLSGSSSSPDSKAAPLVELRPPVKEIVSCLTRISVTDPDLTSSLNDYGWWEQAAVVNASSWYIAPAVRGLTIINASLNSRSVPTCIPR